MPYIKQIDREKFEYIGTADSAGELNYQITKIIVDYFHVRRNYQAINDVVGALEGAKLEFYTRVARPYEDTKIQQNGDVYL